MKRFIKKVAVVTGSSSGIGEAISKELVKRELIVVGLARRIDKLQEIKDELLLNRETYPGIFHIIQCDVTNESEIKETFKRIHQEIGPVSVLINNAGVLHVTQLQDITTEIYQKVFDTNVKGLLLCSKEAVKSMRENVIAGHIVNINSVAGLQIRDRTVERGQVVYNASKHAARLFSDCLRREICNKEPNIKITDLHPGLVETEMTKSRKNQIGFNEFLQTEDIVKACIFALDTPPKVLVSQLTIEAICQT